MSNGDHAPCEADALAASAMTTLIPRLRKLISQRRYSRSAVCRYMGLHTNTLNRLNDENWHPRLDTLQRIETFLRDAEQNAAFDPKRKQTGDAH